MSRLWNNVVSRLWPLPPGAIGLVFGKDRVVAVRATREGEDYCITHLVEEVLPFSLFTNAAPRKEDCASLSQAMQRLAASIPQSYWPLQISLPDPAAIVQVMEFDSLPQTPRERAAIAQFRLEKEYPALKQMQCSTQVLSTEGEKGLLLAVFLQRAWLDCVNSACRAAGFVPSVMDISINHLFNRFYEVIQTTSGDGVLVAVEQDSWSILIWDGSHRPRFVRSRWRDESAGTDEEYELVVQDVERLIMSYVLRQPGRRISEVYLCAGEDDRESMAARLDKRMSIPCIQLDASEKISVAPGLSMRCMSPGTLAAAVTRT